MKFLCQIYCQTWHLYNACPQWKSQQKRRKSLFKSKNWNPCDILLSYEDEDDTYQDIPFPEMDQNPDNQMNIVGKDIDMKQENPSKKMSIGNAFLQV